MGTQNEVRSRARVLVVEGDRSIRDLLTELLVDEGYEVETAVDGDQALALLPQWQPDAILLDLVMPFVDDQEFLYAKSLLNHARGIPTVVISAATSQDDRSRWLESAAAFPKPFDIETLIGTVGRLTRREGASGRA